MKTEEELRDYYRSNLRSVCMQRNMKCTEEDLRVITEMILQQYIRGYYNWKTDSENGR